MPIIAKEQSGSNIPALEAGTYPCRCSAVVDLGTHHDDTYNKDKREILIAFEIPGETVEISRENGDVDVLPRTISKRYTLTLSERGNLRKDLESWRGQAFTEAELAGFAVDKLLGAPAMISVGQKTTSKGRVIAKISGVAKLIKGLEVADLSQSPLYFGLDDILEGVPWTDAVFPEALPGWQREVIQASQEWQAKMFDQQADAAGVETEGAGSVDEDDLPF
jgi:hypothetical protein